MKVGTVKEIYRYPVKSMGGERLREAPILEHGILGDRSFAYKNEAKYLTVQNLPELLNYHAKLAHNGGKLEPVVTSRNGEEFQWNDTRLTEEISAKVEDGQLEQLSLDPTTDRGAYWEDHLLLFSTASLEKISELCGSNLLDFRRFRPNLVIELDSGKPFEEEEWIGKEIVINDVVFRVNQGCERCFYINVDPVNPSLIDSKILKTLVKERNMIAGVYMSVVRTGEIPTGAEVYVRNEKRT
ncbi:MAG: MOSC domain-containing protein [Bacillota bacterium]|nr:MOSC domain-containing protein [Bacillota bacterium]